MKQVPEDEPEHPEAECLNINGGKTRTDEDMNSVLKVIHRISEKVFSEIHN